MDVQSSQKTVAQTLPHFSALPQGNPQRSIPFLYLYFLVLARADSALVTWWPAGFSNRLFGSFPELRGMKPADLGCDRVTAIHKCKWNQPSSRRVLHNRNVNRGWPLDKKTLNISKKIHRSHRSISQADEAASRPWLIQQLRWERHRRSSRKYGSLPGTKADTYFFCFWQVYFESARFWINFIFVWCGS